MKTTTKDLSVAWQICLMVMLGVAIVMLPQFAFATNTTDSPMSNALCTAAAWITGSTGKGIATVGITIIGIGALLGKVSWGMAMIVGVGVAVVFGSTAIVSILAGTSGGSVSGVSVGKCS